MCTSLDHECHLRRFCFRYSKPWKFVRPQWPISRHIYVWWRAFWALWHTFWTVWSIWMEIDQAKYKGASFKWLIYLTNLSYLILTVQSIIHCYVVIYNWNVRKRTTSLAVAPGRARSSQVSDSMTCLFKVLWLLTTVGFNAAVMVTVLYWTLIFKELKHILSIVTHAINTVYVISDMFLIAIPVRLLHFIYSLIYGGAYLVFTIVYHLCHGTDSKSNPYIYRPLNWANPGEAAFVGIGSLLIALPVTHFIQFGLYNLRLCIFETIDFCSCCNCDDGNGTVESTVPKSHEVKIDEV